MNTYDSPRNVPGRLLIAVLLVSMAMLMFEILKTITLSLQVFHQNAFLVVSLALLGLGGGGSIATVIERGTRTSSDVEGRLRRVWAYALAFALLLVLSEIVASRLQGLVPLVLVGVVPYVFAGLFLATVFASWPHGAHRSYFFDLVGAAIGCFALVWLVDAVGDAGIVVLITGLIAALAALILARDLGRVPFLASSALLGVLLLLLPFAGPLFPYRPHETKHYGAILSDPKIDSRLDWSRWGFLGRLDSVIPGAGIERFLEGETAAVAARKNGWDFRFLFASGDNWSYLIKFDDPRAGRSFVKRMTPSAPYALIRPAPEVLNIGLGGGIDVVAARDHGARAITGVEINPLMVEAVMDRHRDFFGDPYHDRRVQIHVMDGRAFVNTTDRRFDLITLTAVDTGAGLAAGANLLSENYLYTEEAFDGYFKHLRDDGVLFVYRPYPQLLRAVVTAVQALRRLGASTPHAHFAVFGDSLWVGAVIGRSPLHETRLRRLAKLLAEGHFGRPYYLPLAQAGQREAWIDRYFRSEAAGRADRFLASFSLDLTPVRDDSPYFYQMSRDLLSSPAGKLLLRLLLWVSIISLLLIVLPLAVSQRGPTRGLRLKVVLYFAGLGFGFMLVEIALIQKLSLFLGHPAYSISVTLFSLLVWSGLGSILSTRWRMSERGRLEAALVGVVAMIGFYALALDPLMTALRIEALWLRALLVALLLAPGSLLMGMPLPTMIRLLAGEKDLIPWAWAINGVSSVIASVIAVLLAMALGFSDTMLVGGAFYLLTLLAYRHEAR